MPPEAAVVALVTSTVTESPGARVPIVQVRTWVPTGPVTAQLPGPVAIDQSMPGPAGSGSVMTTPVAVPTPVLPTTMVKPMGLPVDTGLASAVFVMVSPGGFTTMTAVA